MATSGSVGTLTIKLKFAKKLRRIRVGQPLDKLKIYDVLQESHYPEYKHLLPVKGDLDLLELTYNDEEGDRVTLTDSNDFNDAVVFFELEKKIPSFFVEIKARVDVLGSGNADNNHGRMMPAQSGVLSGTLAGADSPDLKIGGGVRSGSGARNSGSGRSSSSSGWQDHCTLEHEHEEKLLVPGALDTKKALPSGLSILSSASTRPPVINSGGFPTFCYSAFGSGSTLGSGVLGSLALGGLCGRGTVGEDLRLGFLGADPSAALANGRVSGNGNGNGVVNGLGSGTLSSLSLPFNTSSPSDTGHVERQGGYAEGSPSSFPSFTYTAQGSTSENLSVGGAASSEVPPSFGSFAGNQPQGSDVAIGNNRTGGNSSNHHQPLHPRPALAEVSVAPSGISQAPLSHSGGNDSPHTLGEDRFYGAGHLTAGIGVSVQQAWGNGPTIAGRNTSTNSNNGTICGEQQAMGSIGMSIDESNNNVSTKNDGDIADTAGVSPSHRGNVSRSPARVQSQHQSQRQATKQATPTQISQVTHKPPQQSQRREHLGTKIVPKENRPSPGSGGGGVVGVTTPPAVSWKSIAASGNGKTHGGGKKIKVATKAPAAGIGSDAS